MAPWKFSLEDVRPEDILVPFILAKSCPCPERHKFSTLSVEKWDEEIPKDRGGIGAEAIGRVASMLAGEAIELDDNA